MWGLTTHSFRLYKRDISLIGLSDHPWEPPLWKGRLRFRYGGEGPSEETRTDHHVYWTKVSVLLSPLIFKTEKPFVGHDGRQGVLVTETPRVRTLYLTFTGVLMVSTRKVVSNRPLHPESVWGSRRKRNQGWSPSPFLFFKSIAVRNENFSIIVMNHHWLLKIFMWHEKKIKTHRDRLSLNSRDHPTFMIKVSPSPVKVRRVSFSPRPVPSPRTQRIEVGDEPLRGTDETLFFRKYTGHFPVP